MVATIPNSALPTLSPEDRHRLILFFKHGESLELLAEKLADPDLDEFSLQTWASSPDIAAHIAYKRAEALHRSRKNAIEQLEQVLKHTTDLIEKRRVASAILRTINRTGGPTSRSPSLREGAGGWASEHLPRSMHNGSPESHQSHSSHESHGSHDSHESHPPPPPPPEPPPPASIPDAYAHKDGDIQSPPTPLPDPGRSPDDLLSLILNAIQNPDHPERHTGPFTLFNLAGRIRDRSGPAFADYTGHYLRNVIPGIWGFTSAEEIARDTESRRIWITYALTLRDGSTRNLKIQLHRETEGVLKDCWRLGHLHALHQPRRNDTS